MHLYKELRNKASLCIFRKEYEQALTFYKEALQKLKEDTSSSQMEVAACMSNLSSTCLMAGKLDESKKYYKRFEEIMNQIREVREEGIKRFKEESNG